MIQKEKRKLKKKLKKIEEIVFWKNEKKWKNEVGKCAIFLPKNAKSQKPKNRKFWIFLCILCAYSKCFYKITFWCSVVLQLFFYDVWTRSRYLKFELKNFPPEKKALPQKFRGKKFWKKSGNPKIWPTGRNRPNIFEG